MINIFSVLGITSAIITASLLFLFVWIWALVDCLNSEMESDERIIWILVIIFLNFIGALIYFIFSEGKKSKKKSVNNRKLTLSEDKVFFGVCGGIAKYFSTDPALVRILWVIFTIFVSGAGVLLYFIAAIIMPSNKKSKKEDKSDMVIFGILIFFVLAILSIVLIGGAIYRNNFSSVVSEVIIFETDVEKIAEEYILNDYNYYEFNGHNLTLLSKNQVVNEECVIFSSDPYAVKVYDSSCKKVSYSFDIDENLHPFDVKGFQVDLFVVRGKVARVDYSELI